MVQHYDDVATASGSATQSYEEARAAARKALTQVTNQSPSRRPPTPGQPDARRPVIPTTASQAAAPQVAEANNSVTAPALAEPGTSVSPVGQAGPGTAFRPTQPDAGFREAQLEGDLRWRGFKAGAAFFGWLIAISMTVLLTAIVGAVASIVQTAIGFTRDDLEQAAATVGIVTASTLVLTIVMAFYTGGYVAGRLARFDGGRQGFGVWMYALMVSVLAVGLGAFANAQYDLVALSDLPSTPLADDVLTTGAIGTAAALLILTLLFALLGGKQGQRYHDKIDTWLE